MKLKIKDIGYDCLFLMIILNGIFYQHISVFAYFDECITLCASIYICLHIKCIKKNELFFAGCILSLLFLGGIGFFTHSYQSEIVAVIKDIILLIKFPIVCHALLIFSRKQHKYPNKQHIMKIITVYTHIVFICALISFVTNIGMSQENDIRMGIRPYQFLYMHPTFLVYSIVFCSIVLIGNRGELKTTLVVQVEQMIVLLLTMRDKAFAYIIVYVILVFIIPNKNKIKTRYIVYGGLVACCVSANKIRDYFSFSWSPRIAMYSTAIQLAKDNFPIGTGLASFGSSISGEYYSKIYYLYGISQKITPDSYVTLSDAQWPYYLGQFGIIGLLIFIYLLYRIFKTLKEKVTQENTVTIYLMFAYIAIASIVESVFTNESGATIMFAVLLFCNLDGTNIKVSNNELNIRNYDKGVYYE